MRECPQTPLEDLGFRTVESVERDLAWDGCRNVRDLGGLPVGDGGTTPLGRVVRSDNPSRLTAVGWERLRAAGVRTVITLRTLGTTDDEPDRAMVPGDVLIERVVLEDATDPEFRRRCIETGVWMTPLEWAEMLRYWPERCAAAVAAVAHARDGGVVISCGIGRDRTGLVAFLLQAIAGVTAEAIAQDWSHSIGRLVGDPLAGDMPVSQILERAGSTVDAAARSALDMDVESRLREGGLSAADLASVRNRLLG